MVKCEKCGNEIKTVKVNMFNYDGSDSSYEHELYEDNNVVFIDTNYNFTGYGQDGYEYESIQCPFCGQFPFEYQTVDVQELVRVVMWPEEKNQ